MVSSAPDFEHVSDALRSMGTEVGPAELHGTLCGLFCAHGPGVEALWVKTTLASGDHPTTIARDALETLHDLYRLSESELCEELFGFHLLLPDDDEAPLNERVAALGSWCRGFMLGLAEGGLGDLAALPDDVPEVLEDLNDIARVASYETEDDEQNETAYAELVEYVRVAVTLTYQTLQGQAAPSEADKRPAH